MLRRFSLTYHNTRACQSHSLRFYDFSRTFVKGSIEAVMKGRPLTEPEYLGLGKSYCRLNQEQRQEAYAVYKKYASWLESNGYYDSCDRTVDLLNRIRKVSLQDRSENNIRFDKIYIDGESLESYQPSWSTK